MSFDEQPDGDIHGECAHEIHSLQQQLAAEQAYSAQLRELLPKRIPNGFVSFGKYYSEQEDKFNDPYNPMCKFKRKYISDCEDALAANSEDTALRELGVRSQLFHWRLQP